MKKDFQLFTIPNLLTLLNIICGCIAVILALENKSYMVYSALFIGLASIFDFLDGMTARLLKSFSLIGKDLDSLADMISFGIAPGVIMYQLLKMSFYGDDYILNISELSKIWILLIALLIPVFSGLRLAKFNIDDRQSDSFIGLPTPPNSILIASLPVILFFYPENQLYHNIVLNPVFLITLTIFESFMLISEFPMFSLKFKNLQFSKNKIRYIFLGISLILIILINVVAIPLIIFIFILLSAINNIIKPKVAA
jgi:CDP-diacylglycerol---serine O-phosphatidyltransferase